MRAREMRGSAWSSDMKAFREGLRAKPTHKLSVQRIVQEIKSWSSRDSFTFAVCTLRWTLILN